MSWHAIQRMFGRSTTTAGGPLTWSRKPRRLLPRGSSCRARLAIRLGIRARIASAEVRDRLRCPERMPRGRDPEQLAEPRRQPLDTALAALAIEVTGPMRSA